ncbi:hypothetical protein SY88_09700 [Clostridiales bacterium PH28_bin88]|nr:hypothetical protein SY88_09700 [Clostridiales bacterium PH28_bin88]
MIVLGYYQLPNGREPVKDFIKDQAPKDSARILRGFALLEEFWPHLGMPYVRSISGESGLWELRVEGQKKVFRVFFCHEGGKIVLLHAIVKKSQLHPLE